MDTVPADPNATIQRVFLATVMGDLDEATRILSAAREAGLRVTSKMDDYHRFPDCLPLWSYPPWQHLWGP